MKIVRGFSLMEVLAALALLAILLLGVYSGVRSTTLSVGHGSSVIARIDEVRAAREFLRRQLSSATALPWRVSDETRPVVFEGDSTHVRFVSTLPGYLGKLGPQVVEIKLGKGGEKDGALEAELSPLPGSQSMVVAGAQDVLLSRVTSIHIRYARRGSSAWQDRWTEPMALPGAIEITVMPEAGGDEWPPLIVAPRQDPDAVDVRSAARRLTDFRQ